MKKIYILLITSVFAISCNNLPTDALNLPVVDNSKEIEAAAANNLKTKTLCTGWYFVSDSVTDFKYVEDRKTDTFFLNPTPIVIKINIASMEISKSNNGNEAYLTMWFNGYGTKQWAAATEKAALRHGAYREADLKRLAFVIDNKLIETPRVNGKITSGASMINKGGYTLQDIEAFKKQLTVK